MQQDDGQLPKTAAGHASRVARAIQRAEDILPIARSRSLADGPSRISRRDDGELGAVFEAEALRRRCVPCGRPDRDPAATTFDRRDRCDQLDN